MFGWVSDHHDYSLNESGQEYPYRGIESLSDGRMELTKQKI